METEWYSKEEAAPSPEWYSKDQGVIITLEDEELSDIEPTPSREDVSWDPAVPAAKVIAGLKFLDRGRAANVGFLKTLAEGKGLDEAINEWTKGIKGEAHPLVGDFIFELAQENRLAQEKGEILGPNTLTGIFQKTIALIPWLEVNIPTSEGVEDALEPSNLFQFSDESTESGKEYEQVKQDLKVKLNSLFDKHEADALYATIGGILGDIATDPLTYTGIGITKAGRLSKIKEAVEAGEITVKSSSKLALDLDKYEKTGKLQPYEETLTGRLKAGQERVMIGGIPIPAAVAGKVASGLSKSHNLLANSTVGTSIRQIFSTEYGLEGGLKEFKELEESFTDILAFKREKTIAENAEVKKKVLLLSEDLSRITGQNVTPEALNKFITEQVELFDKTIAKKSTILGTTDVSNINTILQKLPAVVRPKVRPEYLTKEAQELITKEPKVLDIVKDLRNKNDIQLREEQSLGILKTSLEEGPTVHKNYISNLLAKADPTQKVIYNPVKKRYVKREVLEQELKKATELEADADRVSYFMHSATPEFKDIIKKQRAKEFAKGSKEPMVYSTKHASTLQRNFRDMTINEINQLAAVGKLPGYEGIKISKAFHDDPAIAQILRDMRHNRSIETLKFLETSKDKFGRKVTKAEAEDLPDGWGVARNPLLRGYAFPTEVAKRLDGHYDVLMNPKKVSVFIDKIYDPATNWYKAWTLGVFPEYHVRNAVSNIWNNYVTGTTNPLVYKIAKDIQNGNVGFITTPGGGKMSYDAIRDQVGVLGIKNKGFMSADIEQTLINEMGYGKWMTLSTNNKAIHYGQKVGEAVDNNARIAKFVDELQKGSTSDRAASAVRHSLFDYTDLTWAEREVGKRAMPFYTWSRKNIPFQLEQMVRQPGKYKAIDTARQEIERNTQGDAGEQGVANWLLENYAVRTRIDKEDGLPRYFLLGSWLSSGDIWRLASVPDRLATDLANPIYKAPLEWLANYDTFKRKTIQREDEEGNIIPENIDFLNMRVSPRTAHLLKNIRLLKAINELIPTDKKMSDIRRQRDRTPEEIAIDLLTGFRTYAQDLEMNKVYRGKKKEKSFQKITNIWGETATPYVTKEGEVVQPDPKEVKAVEDFYMKSVDLYEKLWEDDMKKKIPKETYEWEDR